MRRRLYFLLPDVASARTVANDLLLARINDSQMRFLASRGTDLGELHEASFMQKGDFVHGAEIGLVVGAGCGAAAGLYMLFSPPLGLTLELVTILITALGGALLGAWVGSLVGASVPNVRLKQFTSDIELGKVLLILDVPRSRVRDVTEMLHQRHPEAVDRGWEPTVPAFP